MEEEILALALELIGLDEEQAGGLPLACRLAEAELARRLRKGVRPEDCGERFLAAAAKLALADWQETRQLGQPKKFSAGEISVEEGTAEPSALRRQGLRLLAGELDGEGVYLKGVRC